MGFGNPSWSSDDIQFQCQLSPLCGPAIAITADYFNALVGTICEKNNDMCHKKGIINLQ